MDSKTFIKTMLHALQDFTHKFIAHKMRYADWILVQVSIAVLSLLDLVLYNHVFRDCTDEQYSLLVALKAILLQHTVSDFELPPLSH